MTASSKPARSTATPSAATTSALCSDLAALNGDLDRLKGLAQGPASLDQIKSLNLQVQTDLNRAAQNASGLAAAKLAGVRVAYAAFSDALSALPASVTASQAYASVRPHILALTAALAVARFGSGCS